MNCLLILSAVFLNLNIYGEARPDPEGVGAYAYQDSTGNRYGGTFDLKDGEFFGNNGLFPEGNAEQIFPEYFRNLQSLLQEAFHDITNQRLAYTAAKRAFNLSKNRAGMISPHFTSRFGDFGRFGQQQGVPMMPGYNNAFAAGMIAPGFVHQYAGINPVNPGFNFLAAMREPEVPSYVGSFGASNPLNWHHSTSSHNGFSSSFASPGIPNVDLNNRFAETEDGKPHFYSVQSSAYSTSSNVNGKETNSRGALTSVNKDGKVTQYEVHN